MSKAVACAVGFALICLFGILSFVLPERAGQLPAILTAICGLAGAYFAMQVANNGVKGKCWNQGMYDAEHGKASGEGTDET